MQSLVYNMFRMIFGTGLIEETSDFLKTLVSTLNSLFPANGTGIMNTSVELFATLAAAFLVIFYFIDLGGKASKETLTLQTLTLSFIRLMIAFTLVVYSKEITINLCNLSSNIFYMVAEQTTDNAAEDATVDYGITFWGMKTLPKYTEEVEGGITVHYDSEITVNEYGNTADAETAGTITGTTTKTETKEATLSTMKEVFEDSEAGLFPDKYFKSKGFLKSIPYLMFFLLPFIISLLAFGAAYLFSITNTLNIVVYAFFMPVAVTQVFDDLQRSNAIMYIKRFFALCLNYAGILIILYALSKIQNTITPALFKQYTSITAIDSNNFNYILNFKLLMSMSVVQFSAVGAMAGVSKFTNDLMGIR